MAQIHPIVTKRRSFGGDLELALEHHSTTDKVKVAARMFAKK